ncbi:unnamed protein product [Taenia asiatica]|uniref:CASP-like protein n=1 Tax=Taenia asiatica TaxID=60517 RepID=A0A0R3W1D1_TAEAS|nr:unnamed protein product [Taenia asiatica]
MVQKTDEKFAEARFVYVVISLHGSHYSVLGSEELSNVRHVFADPFLCPVSIQHLSVHPPIRGGYFPSAMNYSSPGSGFITAVINISTLIFFPLAFDVGSGTSSSVSHLGGLAPSCSRVESANETTKACKSYRSVTNWMQLGSRGLSQIEFRLLPGPNNKLFEEQFGFLFFVIQ